VSTKILEADVQNLIRVEGAKIGMILWRNNSGALRDMLGRMVRFGLGNDSEAINKKLKSSDLIGIYCGLFVSIECKTPGWKYTGTAREVAQLAWINLVKSYGGVACFAQDWTDVIDCLEERRHFEARAGDSHTGKRA